MTAPPKTTPRGKPRGFVSWREFCQLALERYDAPDDCLPATAHEYQLRRNETKILVRDRCGNLAVYIPYISDFDGQAHVRRARTTETTVPS